MKSLHHSHDLYVVVLEMLILALVDGDIHPCGVVHEQAPGIRLL